MKWEQVQIRGLMLNLADYAPPFRTTYLSLWPERVAGWRTHPGHYALYSAFPADASNLVVDATGVYSTKSGSITVGRITTNESYSSDIPASEGGVHITGHGYYVSPSQSLLLSRGGQLPTDTIPLQTPESISGLLDAGDYIFEAVTVRSVPGSQVATGSRALRLTLLASSGVRIKVNGDDLDDRSRVDVYVRRRDSSQKPYSDPFFIASLTREQPFVDYTSHLQEQEFANYRFTHASSPPAAYYAGRWFYRATKLLVGEVGNVLPGGEDSVVPYVVDRRGRLAPASPDFTSTLTMLSFSPDVTHAYALNVPDVGYIWAYYSSDELQIWQGDANISNPFPLRQVASFTGVAAQNIVCGAYSNRRIVLIGSGGRAYYADLDKIDDWNSVDTGATNLSYLLYARTAFVASGEGTQGPTVYVSIDGEAWAARTLPIPSDSAHQLAITPRGLIYHDGYVYLMSHHQPNSRVNFYRSAGPEYVTWQIWGNGSGGDDDWVGYVGLARVNARPSIVGFHDGFDGLVYIVGHLAFGFNTSFNGFSGISTAPNIGNEPNARIWSTSIVPSSGLHANKVVYQYSGNGLFWDIDANRTSTFPLLYNSPLFIAPDSSYLIATSITTQSSTVYFLGNNITSIMHYNEIPPRYFIGRTTALPVKGGFLIRRGQSVAVPDIGLPQLRTPHLYIGYLYSVDLGFNIVYGVSPYTVNRVRYDNALTPSVAYNGTATVILYRDWINSDTIAIAKDGTIRTYSAPSGATTVVSDGTNIYVATPTSLHSIDLDTGATAPAYTVANNRLWISGNGRILAVEGANVLAVVSGTLWTETPLFTLPNSPTTLFDSYDDGASLVYLLTDTAMYAWDGSSTKPVSFGNGLVPDWIVISDFLAPPESSTSGAAQKDTILPENTIIWTYPGYINFTNPAYYYTFNLQSSSSITALAQHPSGVIVFAENEAYIMAGRFTSISDTRVYPFPAPIGCDKDTLPAYRGSEIFVIWKGRIYGVTLTEAKRISTIVDETSDPFVQIAYDKEHDHLVARKQSGRTLRYAFNFDTWFDDGDWEAVYSGPEKAIYIERLDSSTFQAYTIASLNTHYSLDDASFKRLDTVLSLEAVMPQNSTPQTVRAVRAFGISARTQGPAAIQIDLLSEHGNTIAAGQFQPYATGSPDGLSRYQVLLPPYIADTIARVNITTSVFVTDIGQVFYGYHERQRPA